ncbi:farnesol dehydrogenase [Stomoxys calcitrans]|uniref:farnesol dehydrogenase n=1 Tax=Stomoxys calcitrans TaxID=35570 RepID=UPI0027E3266C|nr:farnesol dehydrogenase [Stomoxys calcitrans]
MERWQNKIAVVTGASSGIGAATAKALVAKGMIVVGLDRQLEKMENEIKASIPAELQAKFHCKKCDVSKEECVKETFNWIVNTFGGVDVLINNAGIITKCNLLDENNSEDIRNTFEVNVLAGVWCTREAFHSMKQRNFDGHIVNICSIMGHSIPAGTGFPLNIYPSTKHAVKAMTEVLRQELQNQHTKIKVTNISPGGVKTAIYGPTYPDMPTVSGEDIADAIVYCIQTPPHVQIHEMIIKPIGEQF